MALVFGGCDSTKQEVVPDVEATGEVVQQLFYDTCKTSDEIYYATQADNVTYFHDTKGMVNFWDNRYGDITVNGCNVTVISDEYTPSIEFGGPQSTLIYRLDNTYPWKDGDNFMVQANFNGLNTTGSVHGGISFNFFMIHQDTKERLNYVITIYTYGVAWTQEKSEILYDPTTATKFISTTMDRGNEYVTLSPHSAVSNTEGMFRVNITKDNLPIDDPEKWYILFIGIQYEVEESISNGSVNAEFSDFSAYITKGVM
jgi:hypothetical protein